MKRTVLSFIAMLGLLLLVLGTSGAAGGPNKPAQGEPPEIESLQELTLALGDEVSFNKNLAARVVKYNGAVGIYFFGKNVSVFFADGKWVTGLEFGGEAGKTSAARSGDWIFIEGSATRCRVNSRLPGALCWGAGSAFPPYPCMLEVAGKRITLLRFGPMDSEGNGAFEKCAP